MRATILKAAVVALLFAGCLAVLALVYPGSGLPLLTALPIVPVVLAVLFWGLLPGLAAGVVATLGSVFFIGMGAMVGRLSDLTRTDRLRAAVLERAMTRLVSVLSAAQDAIITIDPEGRITSWNAAAERIFGWGRDEVIGRELHPLITAPRYRGEEGPEPPAFPRYGGDVISRTLEMEAVRKSGETFPVELSLASFLEEGRRHAVGIVRDITERKQSEERYRRLFEAVPVGLYRTATDGTILDANPAMVEMLGYPDRQTFMARNAATFYADPPQRDKFLRRAERDGTVHDLEVTLLRCDGSPIECLIAVAATRDAAGAVAWYEGSLRDVTKLRRAEDVRRRSERLEAIGQLAAGVAHDINNILAGIRGFSEFLSKHADAPTAGAGRRILEAVDRADRIIGSLSVTLGRHLHHPCPVVLEEIARAAIASRGRQAAGVVEMEPPAGPVRALADGEAIETVVRELVDNAVHASPANAPVVVRIGGAPTARASVLVPAGGTGGPWAWVSVCDRGSGMDAATFERIFEPYFTNREFGSGAGLGLVRVLGIVRQHGGGIDVESSPGRGTTVTIYLPPAPA